MYQRTRRVIERLLIALIFASTALLSAPLAVSALAPSDKANKVILYEFWGDGCPHCAAAKPFLEDLAKKNPQLELRQYEVWYNDANAALMDKMCKAYGFDPTAVPTIFIGDKHWVGYSDQIAAEITDQVAACTKTACKDAGLGIMPAAADTPKSPLTISSDTMLIIGAVLVVLLFLVVVFRRQLSETFGSKKKNRSVKGKPSSRKR